MVSWPASAYGPLGKWKFFNKPENYTTWLNLIPLGNVLERGKEGLIGEWEIKCSLLRSEFKGRAVTLEQIATRQVG